MCPEERYPGSCFPLIRGNLPRPEDFRYDHRRWSLLHHRNQAASDPFSVLGDGPFLDHPDRGKIVGRVRGKLPLDVDHFPLSGTARDFRKRLSDGVQILLVRRAFHPAQQKIDKTRVATPDHEPARRARAVRPSRSQHPSSSGSTRRSPSPALSVGTVSSLPIFRGESISPVPPKRRHWKKVSCLRVARSTACPRSGWSIRSCMRRWKFPASAILTLPSAILPRFPGPIVVSAGSIVGNGLCAVRHRGSRSF